MFGAGTAATQGVNAHVTIWRDMNIEIDSSIRSFKLDLSYGRSFNVRHPEFIAFSDLYVVVFGADSSAEAV
jgi:hypothetical protein